MHHFGLVVKSWSRPLAATLLVVVITTVLACGQKQEEVNLDEVYDVLLGGETTAFSDSANAFELSARNLTNELRRTFEVGNSFFNQNWVPLPQAR